MSKEIPLDHYFLDEKIDKKIKLIRQKNKIDYNFIQELLDFSYNLLQNFSTGYHSKVEAYLYSSYMQLLKYFQSYIILIEKGLPEAAQAILRSIYELTFRICAICKDSSILDNFFIESIKQKKSILNTIKQKKIYSLIPEDKIPEFQKHLDSFDTANYTKITKKKLAELAGIEEQYVCFQFLSSFVHSDLDCTDSIMKYNGNGIIIDGNLKYENIHESIGLVVYIYGIATKSFLNLLKNESLTEKYNAIEKFADDNWK